MAKNEAKIKFLAETEEFRANVAQANSSLNELRSELRLNAEQMKTNGTSVEGLSERQKLLQEQLDQSRTKTENLSAQLEACTRIYGENSIEAQKLATQVNNARIAEEKIQQEINKVNAELDQQKAAANQTENALERLESTISGQEAELSSLKNEYSALALEYGTNSREARELAAKISTLSGELNENRSKLASVETAADNLEGELRDVGDAADDAAGGFTVWKGALADLASSGIQSILGGITNLGSSLWGLGDETRELRTEMGKLDAAFSASNHSADTARATYETLYGVIGETDQSVEAAQQIALLSNNTKDAAQWADLAAGVVGRFGDALQPETFFEAANETMKLGEATGAYTQMLEGTGVSVDKFNEGLAACRTEEEKQAYMLKVSEKALGAAGEAYNKNNAQIISANEAQSRYNNGLAGLGQIIEPIKTVFVNGMASMLEKATEFISGLDMEMVKTKIQGAFDYLNTTVFPTIKTAIQWVIDNKDIILSVIAGIVAGIAAFKVITFVQKAVEVFKTLNVVLAANPIGLVAIAIAGLVTAFTYLWNNCESFRNFWIGLWEGIKNAASVAWQAITGFFSGAWNVIKGIWNGAGEFFSGIWNGIKGIFSAVGTWFSSVFAGAWNGIKNAWSGVKNFFAGIWNGIKEIFNKVKEWFAEKFKAAVDGIKNAWSTVKSFFSDIWNGIKNVFNVVKTWFVEKFRSAWDGIKNAWSSVKTWFSNIWTGIKNVFASVKTWFSDKFTSAWNSIKNVFSGWGSFFGGLWDKIKNTFSGLGTKLGDAIGGSVKSALNKVFGWVESALNKGIGLINGAIGIINKIPGVSIGKIGGLSLPRLASGGVLRAETAFIGGEYPGARNNPEIVTPQSIMRETFADVLNATLDNALHLDRLAAAIENLADRPINIDVDGYRLATATAGASDSVSGNRLNLKNRGLAL